MQAPIVLVYPFFRDRDPVDKLFAPLGVAYLASQLKERSLNPSVVDCTFSSLDSAAEEIIAQKPAVVGIHVMVTLSRNALALAARIRAALPETLLVAGGPLPSVYPGRFFPAFDLVFRGESDLVFPDFCRDYLAAPDRVRFLAELEVNDYPGIAISTNKSWRSSPPVHRDAQTLDRLPPPDRSQFPHRLYQQHWHQQHQASQATIMLSRGCPLTCDFCSKPVWGDDFRKLDLEKALDETCDIVDLGYESLWIADDSFTLDRDYLHEFCQRKLHRGIALEWTCLSRARKMDKETVRLMKKAGCSRVYLGLESGSDTTLQLMGKQNTVQEGLDAVHLFTREGIQAAGFFLVGYPGETRESVEKTLALALRLPLEEISINVPLPLPGSALYSRVKDRDCRDDWEKANASRLLYASEFDQDWLKMRIEETMNSFRNQHPGPAKS